MNFNTSSTTNIIPGRELRSKTASSISLQTQSENTNLYRSNSRTKPTATSTPTLGRKIVKPSLQRSKSVKTSSSVSKTKKTLRSAENNENNGSGNDMDQGYTEQITASNLGDQAISNSTTNDNPINQNQTDVLNISNETVDEAYQIKRTTMATRKDIMNYFVKQPDGSFKCTICTNSNKVRSLLLGAFFRFFM